MPLIVKTKTELLQEARQYLEENTEITNFNPGGTARALLEIISTQQAEQSETLNANIIQAYVSRASGEFLGRIGELVGVTRKNATYAADVTSNNFKFYIDPSTGMTAQNISTTARKYAVRGGITPDNLTDTGFIIRKGTPVGGPGGVMYKTTDEARFEGSTKTVFVGVIADGLGPFYNISGGTLKLHTIQDNHLDLATVAPLILCSNNAPITSGKGLEGDEELRFRITQASIGSEAANETAVRLAALSVPGVNNIVLRKYTEGIGTYNVFIIGDAPIVSQGILNAAQVAIENVQALGMRGSTSAPSYLGIEVTLSIKFVTAVTLAQKHDIRIATAKNVMDYINNIPIGGEFIINELIQRVMDTDSKILDMRFLRFGYGEYNPTTSTNNDFMPLMATNQKSQWDEKFYTNASLTAVCEEN